MSTPDPMDRGAGQGPTPEEVAGELAAEMARSEETALPPALARRLVELGRKEMVPVRVLGPVPSWRARAGWVLAAAAVAAWVLVPSPFARTGDDAAPTVASVVEEILADSAALHVAWAPSTDPAAVAATGEVVWDATRQRGVLRIRGLVPNDPRLAQYQLWIIDAERDARYPVDGGVFDVTSDGEVLVPVSARLSVRRPTLFAVTLETPGGVVVSSRERLVLAAPVSG